MTTQPPLALRPHWHNPLVDFARQVIALVERWLTPAFALALRFYIASVFLRSGWLKISAWDSTLYLFSNEYHVALLPPHVAAVMATMGELGLPILLVLGLAGRFGAAGLSVLNVVAAVSFPDLSDLGLQDHYLWGTMLLMLALNGCGRFSLDHWLLRDQDVPTRK